MRLFQFVLFFGLLLFSLLSEAQENVVFRGKVVDSVSGTPMPLTVVALVKSADTSLITYTTTDKEGSFMLKGISTKIGLKLIVTHVGYHTHSSILPAVRTPVEDCGIIRLKVKTQALQEVTIRADRSPVTFNKDTIEFSAEAFKTRPNAIVEDLLKKLPGLQVFADGSINFNGKSVSKVLVNGKNFFGSEIRIATTNLDAEIIDKIQIYDDRGYNPNHTRTDLDLSKVINLKFKKKYRKSIVGKVHGGYGSDQRYEAGGLINSFRDTLQVSLLGSGNNVNQTAFTPTDLYKLGGLNRGGNDLNSGGRPSQGIENEVIGGFNLNDDYGTKLKLNLMYIYNKIEDVYANKTGIQSIFGDTTSRTAASRNTRADQTKHTITGSIDWSPDTTSNLNYNGALAFHSTTRAFNDFNSRTNNFFPLVDQSIDTVRESQKDVQVSQNISFHKKINADESVSIDGNLSTKPSSYHQHNISDLMSYTPIIPNASTNYYTRTQIQNFATGLKVAFRQKLNKTITVTANLDGNYSKYSKNAMSFSIDSISHNYDISLPNQSYYIQRIRRSGTITTGIEVAVGKNAQISASVTGQDLLLQNTFNGITNLVTHPNEFYILPHLGFSRGGFSMSYDMGIEQPNIDDMIPYRIISSPLRSFQGNPLLKPVYTHKFNFNFYHFDPAANASLSIYSSVAYENNTIIYQFTTSSTGNSEQTPFNSQNSFRSNCGITYGKQLAAGGKWKINSTTSVNGGVRDSYFYVNQLLAKEYDDYFELVGEITASWNNVLDIQPSFNLFNTFTHYHNAPYPPRNFALNKIATKVSLHWPKLITWDIHDTYISNNAQVAGNNANFNLLNAAVSVFTSTKNYNQLKFSVFDLLNQNTSVSQGTFANTVETQDNLVLKRYFLLSFIMNIKQIKRSK
jgi:hypothetical protein